MAIATPPEAAPAPIRVRRLRLLIGLGFAVVAVITAVVVGLVVASGGAPKVAIGDVPTPSAADAAACRTLQAALPESISDGLPTRAVEPNSPLVHAWGTPAVVLRCGIERPASYDPAGVTSDINGILWYSADVGDATVFTTFRRTPRVSLAIPKSYEIPFDVLVSLTPTLTTGTHPTDVP